MCLPKVFETLSTLFLLCATFLVIGGRECESTCFFFLRVKGTNEASREQALDSHQVSCLGHSYCKARN